jgi:hypothetical protein
MNLNGGNGGGRKGKVELLGLAGNVERLRRDVPWGSERIMGMNLAVQNLSFRLADPRPAQESDSHFGGFMDMAVGDGQEKLLAFQRGAAGDERYRTLDCLAFLQCALPRCLQDIALLKVDIWRLDA